MNYYQLELEIRLAPANAAEASLPESIPKWAEAISLYQTLFAADLSQATEVAQESYRRVCNHYGLAMPAVTRCELTLLPEETVDYTDERPTKASAGVLEHEQIVFLSNTPGKKRQGCSMFLLVAGTIGFFFSAGFRPGHTFGDLILNFLPGIFSGMMVLGIFLNWSGKRRLSRTGEPDWQSDICFPNPPDATK